MHPYDEHHDEHHGELLRQRAEQFHGQVRRFQGGALDPEFFKQLRLRNGLYKERYAHMLRIAIPYGVLNSAQLLRLARIARDFDRGFGHFTTRQNIQLNWPELTDVPEILCQLAEVGMHAIQTSGSCVRNITCDHLAGVATDEVADPRPWCELIRDWCTLHPEFNWLPRKFKIAVSGAQNDRAAIQLHDIGLRLFLDQVGQPRFCVYVGGGMGRTPVIGKVIRESLAGAKLTGYLHAILRVYNQYGRRDHKYRSRIKILVNDLGIDTFRQRVEKEWRDEQSSTSPSTPTISEAEIARAKSFFVKPVNRNKNTNIKTNSSKVIPVSDQRFLRWREHNTLAHRDENYKIVYVSLKAPGAPPGDMNAEQMEQLARLARDHSADEIRVSHEQNLVLPQVKKADLFAVWHELNRLGLATPNIGTLNDMICCPGLDYCSLANAGTIPIARQINQRLYELERLYHIGEIKLKMSGCMNACGHHHAGHIGILGVDKKGQEWYQITLGGSSDTFTESGTRLGARLGPALPREKVTEAIERLVETYLTLRRADEKFLDTVIRTGVAPFKERVYADYQKPRDYQRPVAA